MAYGGSEMESGRFAIVILIIVILVGGLAYYENTQNVALGNQIGTVQSKAENAELMASQAKATANEAKTALASLTASTGKAGDIGQLTKEATDAATAAAKSADEAKQVAADLDAEKNHPTKRK
jgi:hypothetical protein